jgi:hypothetical protein
MISKELMKGYFLDRYNWQVEIISISEGINQEEDSCIFLHMSYLYSNTLSELGGKPYGTHNRVVMRRDWDNWIIERRESRLDSLI